ncbi:hypothetical protein D3C86_2258550 [compost metagenome]
MLAHRDQEVGGHGHQLKANVEVEEVGRQEQAVEGEQEQGECQVVDGPVCG